MNTQMQVSVAEQGCKKTTNSAKPRRTSYYKKKGRQGRRTKLTSSLLGAITKIINETEILSISHLSQELLARGHNLSRSTVFRAMEVLGLWMDRDRKVWCAGQARLQFGHPAQETEHDEDNSATANTFSGRPEDHPSLTAGNFSYAHQIGYAASNFQPADDYMNSIDMEMSLNGGPFIVNHSHNRQTKQEIDDSLNLVSQEFDMAVRPASTGSMLLEDEWTDAKDKSGPRLTNVMTSTPSQRRGRKRKSDCPAKFGVFRNSRETCVDATCWPSTTQQGSSNGQLKVSSVNLSADRSINQWTHAPHRSSVKANETCTPSPGVFDYGTKNQDQPQPQHLQEQQVGKTRAEKLTKVFKSTAESSILPSTLTQSSSRDSLLSEPKANAQKTPVSGKIDNRKKRIGNAPKLRRAALDYDMAGFVEWNNSKFVLRDRRLIGSTLKDDHVPMTSFKLQGGGTDPLLQKSTPRSQRCQQSVPDAQTEVMHRDGGHPMQPQSSAANGVLNLSSKSQHAKAGASKGAEQCLDKQTPKTAQLLAGVENKPKANCTMPGLRKITPGKNMGRETDPQTARLHALTSNLAAKTSKISEAAIQIFKMTRGVDGKHLPDLYFDNVNPELNAGKNRTIDLPAVNGSRVTRQKSSVRSANKHGASAYPQRESVQSSQNACDTVNAPASSDVNCFSKFLPELKSWMQDVSDRLNAMENQLQYLTQVATQPNGTMEEAEEKLSDERTGDREVEEMGGEDAGDEDEEMEEEESEGSQNWDKSLPPLNTSESNDMINKLMSDERWTSFSPYVGGTRLAIRLARDCIFGSKVLSRSTVTGRNGMKPLQQDGIRKIKDCLMEIYGPKCSEVEREILWKMVRESLSQLCKRTRRQFSVESNDKEMDEQA